MTSTLLLLASLTAALAGRDSVGTISGPRGLPDRDTVISLGLKGGAAFLLGPTERAYGAGFSLGGVVDVPVARITAMTLELDHSLHQVVRPDHLFETTSHAVTTDSVDGSQRHFSADFGVRIGIPLEDELLRQEKQVLVYPWVRLAAGVAVTDQKLDVASFGGSEPIHTTRTMGIVAPGLGMAVRIGRPVTLQIGGKAVAYMGVDHDEVHNDDVFRVDWRMVPTLDVLFNI